MSDASQGAGWWQASDGRWYPPASAPRPDLPPPPPRASPAGGAGPTAWAPPTAPPIAPPAAGFRLPAGVTLTDPWQRLGAYIVESLLFVFTCGIGWVIWAATLAGDGQTPAKKLLGQRVIHTSTLQPVSIGTMFWMRGLLAGIVVQFATVFTFGIILLMPFWDGRNQNLWDKVSSTYVVLDPADAWRTALPRPL